jgi:hypothetical protein
MNDIAIQDSAPPAVQGGALARSNEQTANVLAMIDRAARDASVDVQKMQALLDMQERVMKRHAETEFTEAFARLSARLPRIKKNGTLEYPINKNDPDGPKRKIANFAKWEDIDAAIRPLLTAEGFSLSWESAPRAGEGGGLMVTGHLGHVGGHVRSATIPLPLDTSGGKNNLQGYGSTFRYGQRYTATMLLNFITEGEDDDGVRGADEFISDAQAAQIHAGVKALGRPLDAFLEYMGVRSVEEIQVSDFPRAMNALRPRQGAPRR